MNLAEEFTFSLSSDRFETLSPLAINRTAIIRELSANRESRQYLLPLVDRRRRLLHAYCTLSIGKGDSLQASLWVPYWIVNHSGLPLVIKQEATDDDAAGQFDEHERAKDRNPLMFSFTEGDCPQRWGERFFAVNSVY